MLYDGRDFYKSKKHNINIVDRVGGGDSFGGGLIYALCRIIRCRIRLSLRVAASCLKHTIEGDFNLMSVGEVTALAGGDGSGRVQR